MIIGKITNIVMKPELEKTKQRSEFAKIIERADRDCPIPVALGNGAVTGIKLEGGYVTFYISYNNDFLNILSKLNDEEKVKEGILMCFLCINAQGNNQGDLIMDILDKFGYGLRVVITQSANGRFECSASVDDIRKLRERYKLNPHEALFNLLTINVESEQENLPMTIDEGMIMTDIYLEGDNIVTTMLVDEELYSIDEMLTNKDYIKEIMIEESLNDPESNSLFNMCKISHTGLTYRIYGNSSRRGFEITISSDEIRQIVQLPSSINAK